MLDATPIDLVQEILSALALVLALAFSLTALLRKEHSCANYLLVAGLLATGALEAFDIGALLDPGRLYLWKKLSLSAEACLPACWLLFSLCYARRQDLGSIPLAQRCLLALALCFPVAALALPAQTFFYSPDFAQERMLYLGRTGFAYYLALLIYLVIALVNLEMTLANATRSSRWKVKFEILGTGSLLGLLVFYYSQGLLYRTINMNLLPVKSVALVVAVVLTGYSQHRGNGVKIQVSSSLFFKSLVLFAVGLYLVGLGLVGEAMQHFGESFQRSLVMAFALVAGIGLMIVLLSESVKRRIRVFLRKNFYQNKYDYRSQWLSFTDRLSSSKSGEELLTSILTGYCDAFGMGCAALFLSDEERRFFHAAAGLEISNAGAIIGADDPVVSFLAQRKWVVNFGAADGAPPGEPSEFFRANAACFVIPLPGSDSLAGFIVLGKPLNREESYNFEDYDLMKTLACQASSAILNLRLSDQLAHAREMEAIGRVSSFVIHDLKNLVYTVSLIADNARDFIAEPDFQQDMLESLGNTVAKMKILIARLKELPESLALDRGPADLLSLVSDTAALVPGAKIRVTGCAVNAEIDRGEVQKVALNLMLNALDATEGEGPVLVEVGGGERAFIRVRDEGCGIPEEFLRRHLFTPFATTKKKGMGIGLYQCKQIVEAHGGKIEVTSVFGQGTEFTVWFPLGQSRA